MIASQSSTCLYCDTPTTDQALYCCPGCKALAECLCPPQAKQSPWTYLDTKNFQDKYRLKSSEYDYQLYVKGIHCSSCVHLIEKLPEYDASIQVARVDLGQSLLYLKTRPGFSLAKVLELIKELGYEAQFILPSTKGHSSLADENKALLKRLAIAGACAGNIMLFVIPIYSGLVGTWVTIFNWVSFTLFLPIVFYSGTIFYKSAWQGLRLRNVSIDLPITIALISSFILSTVNLLRGEGAIYFDSTASFIFLILGSRYFLKRTQQRYLTSANLEDITGSENYLRGEFEPCEVISLEDIKAKDIIILKTGQTVPADCLLESNSATVDVSVLNGEPLPRHFSKGMEILAGSKIISESILLKVKKAPADTHLAKTLQQLKEGLWRKSQFVAMADRLAQYLVSFVFALAIIFFAYYFSIDPQEAFNRSLALIVLACPCALALSSPLTIALAIKKAQNSGILIKNADVFEKLVKIKNVFFDKTGTLTNYDLTLAESSLLLSEKEKAIILGLEKKSYHPIAFAFRKAWANITPFAVSNATEIPGKGVIGVAEENLYEVISAEKQDQANYLILNFKKNSHIACQLKFENSLRLDAGQAVSELKSQKIDTFILSGDSTERVSIVAKAVGIAEDHVFSNLLAENKKDIVNKYSNSCMVGDGTNDALSLKAADVGIAIQGSTHINIEAADVCFTRGGLQPLIQLFKLSKDTQRVLIRNLSFSLIYNVVGGTLALSGFVSPWLAAILMPLSSFLLLTSTLWGSR